MAMLLQAVLLADNRCHWNIRKLFDNYWGDESFRQLTSDTKLEPCNGSAAPSKSKCCLEVVGFCPDEDELAADPSCGQTLELDCGHVFHSTCEFEFVQM